MLKIIGFVLLIGLGLAVILSIGYYISPRDELKPADAIVVISGGDTSSRTLEAVRLYKNDWAPILIFAGAAEDPNSPSNARVMRSIAIGEGVPSDVVIVEESSRTTRQNAVEVAAIIKAFSHDRIVLVTSPYHQRRASMEFSQVLGESVELINHPAPDENWSRRFWWISPVGWYLTLTEIPRVLFTWINLQLTQ